MAVRWPDGSYTGSLKADASAAPVEPEPEIKEAVEEPEAPKPEKKEVKNGDR